MALKVEKMGKTRKNEKYRIGAPKKAKKPDLVKYEMFAVLRNTEGRVWLDTHALETTIEGARNRADDMDKEIPQWANANPQHALVRVWLSIGEQI